MAHDAPQATGPGKLVIRNIGLLLSGALEKPILDADTIVAENGKITAIGRAKDVDTESATTIVDANGTTVAPGLIDSHVHPVAGDWTPRQNQSNWIDSYLHGGVTTMISAGEVHMPGRPHDVVGHINGVHAALPDDQIRCICEGCKRGLELVHNGNERSALFTLRTAREMGDLNRVILGTDAPAGSGVQPLGILRMVSMLSSLGEVPAEIAFCFATGNTARMRALDCGLIEVGRAADFVLMDKAQHSPGKTILDSVQLGDLPGIGMTIIDGIVRTQRSRNTPPAGRVPEIVGH